MNEETRPSDRRSRLYRDHGIILRRRDFQEADRILTVFLEYQGKSSLLARGVRRTSSRLAGNLEPFSVIDLFMARGRNFDTVTQAMTRDSFRSLRADELKLAYAGYFADIADMLTAERQEQRDVFLLLKNAFQALNEGADSWLVARQFEMSMLNFSGFTPELMQCLSCSEEIQEVINAFSLAGGGVICDRCRQSDPTAVDITPNALKVMRVLGRGQGSSLQGIALNQSLQDEVERHIVNYLTRVTEREPRSYAVMRQIIHQIDSEDTKNDTR